MKRVGRPEAKRRSTKRASPRVPFAVSRAARIRSILALAIILIGFALWSMSVSAQVPAGPAAAEPDASAAPIPEVTPDEARGSAHESLRAGDAAFAKTDFAAAELEYRRAAEREHSFRAYYNLGVALARQGRDAEAAEAFGRARGLAPADEPKATVDAAYNAGTAAATIEELEQSVEAYVDALRTDPHDREAKENLAQVLRQLRRQREEQQQQQQQQQEGSEEAEDDESTPEPDEGEASPPDSEGGEQQAGEDEAQSPEPSQNERDAKEEQQQADGAAAEPTEDVERAEAERLLNLARDLERETQERLKLGERTRARPEKDW